MMQDGIMIEISRRAQKLVNAFLSAGCRFPRLEVWLGVEDREALRLAYAEMAKENPMTAIPKIASRHRHGETVFAVTTDGGEFCVFADRADECQRGRHELLWDQTYPECATCRVCGKTYRPVEKSHD